MSKSALPVRLLGDGARRGPMNPSEREMARVLQAVAEWRRARGGIGPYVLMAVFMPGGIAIAPLLYWRNRKERTGG